MPDTAAATDWKMVFFSPNYIVFSSQRRRPELCFRQTVEAASDECGVTMSPLLLLLLPFFQRGSASVCGVHCSEDATAYWHAPGFAQPQRMTFTAAHWIPTQLMHQAGRYKGQAHFISTITTSESRCQMTCLVNPRCLSYAFKDGTCVLLDNRGAPDPEVEHIMPPLSDTGIVFKYRDGVALPGDYCTVTEECITAVKGSVCRQNVCILDEGSSDGDVSGLPQNAEVTEGQDKITMVTEGNASIQEAGDKYDNAPDSAITSEPVVDPSFLPPTADTSPPIASKSPTTPTNPTKAAAELATTTASPSTTPTNPATTSSSLTPTLSVTTSTSPPADNKKESTNLSQLDVPKSMMMG